MIRASAKAIDLSKYLANLQYLLGRAKIRSMIHRRGNG